MDNTGKAILMQVAYKGVIELAKKSTATNEKIDEVLEARIWTHYQMLERLIEKAISPYATNEDLTELENLVNTSTLDEDQRIEAEDVIVSQMSKSNYEILRTKLLENQLSVTDRHGSVKQVDLVEDLKKKDKVAPIKDKDKLVKALKKDKP